jgi:MFS family permease
MWWTSAEQPLRLEAYYCTNGIATMIGGLLGYAIGHITTGSLERWMYVFIIFGSVSIVWGVVVLIFLPDIPSTAKFLTERERYVAVERVAANRQGVKNTHFKRYQLVQTLQDPKTWILFIMAVGAQVPNSAITSVSILHHYLLLTLLIHASDLRHDIVHFHHRRLLRIRHTRHTVSSNTRWRNSIRSSPRWWIHLFSIPKYPLYRHDRRKPYLYHRSCNARCFACE